jgi:tetratricopeptide (TPR) repeat protein
MSENNIEQETPEQILKRTEKMLAENPDHAFAHYERANAFKDLGNLSDAYISISKAVELDGNDPFYHFIKGEILNEGGEYRAALISYDTAVNLNPDDTFYLCCRAGLLFQFNKLKPSIDDCNRVIELDSGCLLAYMIRKDIYELMGMEDKAEIDQITINRLNYERNDDWKP